MNERVTSEWRSRIAAEYGSATITSDYVSWLLRAGAPPDLIEAALVIVGDEMIHSRMSFEVYVAAGGSDPPAIDSSRLGLVRREARIEWDLLREGVRVFCLGETVAVPLFRHMREHTAEPCARAALDRILVDEVRHRDFGWDVLDWLMTLPFATEIPARLARELPEMFEALSASYGEANEAVRLDDGAITDIERAWGVAPPREYAEILARTIEREYKPRFAARGIAL